MLYCRNNTHEEKSLPIISGYYIEGDHDKRTVVEPAVKYVNKERLREEKDINESQGKFTPKITRP